MGTKDKRAALEQQLKTQSERISQRFQKAQAQVEPKKMTVQGVVKQYPWAIALGAATIGALIGVVVVMRNKTGDDVKTIGRGAKIRVPRSIADQVRVTHDQSELQRAVQSGEKVLIYDATPKASADWMSPVRTASNRIMGQLAQTGAQMLGDVLQDRLQALLAKVGSVAEPDKTGDSASKSK